MNSYLLLWEFSKKQEYIFRSNRLKDNVGASIIMKNLSEDFSEYGVEDKNFMIKGGGKNIYIFDSKEKGQAFIKKFTSDIIKKYPGLELFIVAREADLKNTSLKEAVNNLYEDLEKKKRRKSHSAIQMTYGMEKMCSNTGMPASYKDGDEYISSEIKAKRMACDRNQSRCFEKLLPEGYELITSIKDLIDGEKSYIAVVHIDGNGMGKKFKKLNDGIVRKNNETMEEYNKRYFKSTRDFSLKVTEIYENAFKKMCERIEEKKSELSDITKIDKGYFPVRPLIMAGDDITYICNGHIGIESARYFIAQIEKESLSLNGKDMEDLHACAGIAIVKSGYPFKKSYELAEDLCRNSKKAVLLSGKDTSAIDFHISRGELYDSITEIREKEYKSSDGISDLTMKPLFLDKSISWKNYDNFLYSVENMEKAIAEKDAARSKIKAMRDEFKKGPEATENFFKFYNIPLRYFSYFEGQSGDYCFNMSDSRKTCMYLDGIEAMEFLIRLC